MPENTSAPRVMISSTFIDLKEHRAAAIKALLDNGLFPVVMEHNVGTPDDHVISASLAMVGSSAAYICLIGDRYGQTPNSAKHNLSGLSVTELEFDKALGRPLPIRLLDMGEKHRIRRDLIERDPEQQRKLAAFRAKAKKLEPTGDLHRLYQSFNSLAEFKRAIQHAAVSLRDHFARTSEAASPGTGARPQTAAEAAARSPRKPRNPAAKPPDFRIAHRLETDGIVEFKAHPIPGNSDDTFRLDATLRFGTLTYDHNETPVDIALTDADITITSDAYQYAPGSLVCDRTDHAWLKPRAGSIGIEGPLRGGALHGDPLGTDHLAIMRRTAEHEGPVTVEIRARSVQIRMEAQDQGASINRQVIIDAILGEGERRDPQGRLVFARARITRRTPT